LRREELPQLFKVDLVLFHELGVVEDDQVLLVSADSLARPVERACDEDLTINQAVLVVHVSVRVVIHGGGDTVKAKSPHISPVELSALIIDNQPALDTFLECMRDSIRQLVVRECEHTNVKGLLCSTNNLRHLDDVSLRWEEHRRVVDRLCLMQGQEDT